MQWAFCSEMNEHYKELYAHLYWCKSYRSIDQDKELYKRIKEKVCRINKQQKNVIFSINDNWTQQNPIQPQTVTNSAERTRFRKPYELVAWFTSSKFTSYTTTNLIFHCAKRMVFNGPNIPSELYYLFWTWLRKFVRLFCFWLPGANAVRQEKVPKLWVKRENSETSHSKKPLLPLWRRISDDRRLIRCEVMADPVCKQRVFNSSLSIVLH